LGVLVLGLNIMKQRMMLYSYVTERIVFVVNRLILGAKNLSISISKTHLQKKIERVTLR